MKHTLTLLTSLLVAPLAAISAEPTSTTRAGDVLAAEILQRVESATSSVLKRVADSREKAAKAQDFKDLVTTGQWNEVWPGKDGKPETREVTGEVWNAAIQAALDKSGGVILPKQDKPYYLDGPIILKSGQFLIADSDAEIRLKPGVNTCMVRNANVRGFREGPVPADLTPDTDILVEGGIWTTLGTARGERNGNMKGRSDATDSVPGAHGVILFNNARQFVIRNLTVRQSTPFAVHISISSEFLVENITLQKQHRDGVHVNGPASQGVIRRLNGSTSDDYVALNSWEWANYAPSFGPIHQVLVEDVQPQRVGWNAIRLLPGVKRFASGKILDCSVTDIVFRRLTGVPWLYALDQPNLEWGRDRDFSIEIGRLRNIHVLDLTLTGPPRGHTGHHIHLHADVDGFSVCDVLLEFQLSSDYRLLSLGPASVPYGVVELYSPDRDSTVRNLSIRNVRYRDADGKEKLVENPESLVRVIQQKVNPDYPKTTPRGGTGKGIWLRSVNTASVAPVDLRCEYLVDPAGIDEKQPRLSWRLLPTDADAYDQRQTAYQVSVSGDLETLGKDQGDRWDSGQVASDQTTQVVYRGRPLTSRLSCFWKVRVKDERGVWSGWSEPARWTMELQEPSDWTAQWIGSDQFVERYPHQIWESKPTGPTKNPLVDPWLRRSFILDEQPQRAVVYVASVGYHELYVNGKRIGDDVLSPPVTDLRKRVGYVAYDISGELCEGKNVIGLWLGPGWCLYPYNKTPDKPQTPMVLAQAEIALPGGKQVRVVTDGSWKMHPSPSMLLGWWENTRFGGEKYDARQEIPDWNRPAYDDGPWKAATVYTPNLTLSAAMVEPNRCMEVMTPVSVQEKEPGVWRADFGKVFTGMLWCDVSGEPGSVVDFLMSEIESHEHTFSYWDQYVIGSSGKGTFQNRFNFFVGRWVTIRGLKAAPKPGDLRAWRVRPAYERAGQFECSSPLLNDIYRTTLQTFENLTVGSYIGGDMSRERVGSTFGMGDFRTGLWSFRLGAFFAKWLTDWRDAQSPDGYLPAGAPYNSDTGGGPSSPFSAANMPWGVYCHYADMRLLQRNHVILTGWLDWIGKKAKDGVISRYEGNPWKFLGEWVAPGCPMDYKDSKGVQYADMPETQFFINCFHVYTLRTAARQAAALGRADEAARHARRADEVAAAVHKQFFKPAESSYVNGGQAYLAIALAAAVPPQELDAAVMKRLEDQIVVNDKGRLNAGQLGLTFLFMTLHERGRDDLVLRMMNTREYPGWGNMLSKGATTWWEDFEGHSGQLCFSYLHPPFWLMQAAGGLNLDPTSPGFQRFVVKPGVTNDPSLTWARCSYESEWGTIKTGWRTASGRLELDVTVPPNTTAIVHVPACGKASVSETRNAVGRSGAARWLRDEAGFVVFEAQPGRYQFIGDSSTR